MGRNKQRSTVQWNNHTGARRCSHGAHATVMAEPSLTILRAHAGGPVPGRSPRAGSAARRAS